MATKTTKQTLKKLGPKHVKAPAKMRLTGRGKMPSNAVQLGDQVAARQAAATVAEQVTDTPTASVQVESPVVASVPTFAVGDTVAYDHPSCIGQGKSGVVLAEPVDGKVLVKFGGGRRRVLIEKLVPLVG